MKKIHLYLLTILLALLLLYSSVYFNAPSGIIPQLGINYTFFRAVGSSDNPEDNLVRSLNQSISPRQLIKFHQNTSHNRELLKKVLQMTEVCNSGTDDLRKTNWCHNLSFPGKALSKRFPRAIIIGCPKSRTTLMVRILNQHPFISITKREPALFLQTNPKTRLHHMSPAYPNQLVMEKTPTYINDHGCPLKIKSTMGEDMKFLLLLRDPVQRTLAYQHHIKKDELIEHIHQGEMKKLQDSREILFYQSDNGSIQVFTEAFSVRMSRYVGFVKHWLKYYPLDHFHFINFDDIVKKPLEVMKGIERFLGLPQWYNNESFYAEDEQRLCQRITKVVASRTSRNINYEITSNYSCSGNINQHNLSENLRNILTEHFRPFNENLYSLIGVDFGWQ